MLFQETSNILKEMLKERFSIDEIEKICCEVEKGIKSFLRVINKEDKLVHIPIKDILFIDREGSFAFIQTREDQYKQPLTFEVVKELISNFNFEISDQKILVNMNQVKKYNSEIGRVYFDENPTKENLYTFLSTRNVSKFRNIIGKEHDLSLKEIPLNKKRLFSRELMRYL